MIGRPVSASFFEQVLAAAPDAIVVVDADAGTIVYATDQVRTLLGHDPQALVGRPIEILVPPRCREIHPRHRAGYASEPRVRAMGGGMELHALRADGSDVRVEISLAPVRGDHGGLVAVAIRDVTARLAEREGAVAESVRAAALSRAIADSVIDGLCVADARGLLTFVNPAALRLLGYQSAAELIGRPAHATIHRTPADGTPHPAEKCPLTQPADTGEAVHVEDVFWRCDGTPLPVAFSSAPLALAGGVGVVVAFRDMTAMQTEREELRAQARDVVWFEEVREALEAGRFVLHGQPVVSLATGAVVNHELLLRMVSTTGELIAPGLFLPAAEKYGLINDIDRWVISEAVAQAAAGRPVAVNLSAESVGRVEILLHIEREMARTGAPAANLTFEVTETALMADLAAGCRFAERLVGLGCAFSLDDFGTGYGSLTYLRQLPITHVKIDVQFVREMASSEADRRLVEGIVHIARSMGKTTIAEGVEDEQTLRLLRGYGVDYAQGYHLGRPGPLAGLSGVGEAARTESADQPVARKSTPALHSAAEPTRDEAAELRDLSADARDVAADVRDQTAGEQEEALRSEEESTLQTLLVASREARRRAAADRAGARGDRRRAAADRGPPADRPASPDAVGGETARQRDAAAGSRDVAADARDEAAGRQEEILAAAAELSGSTSRALATVSEDLREHSGDDRADSASDRRYSAADREHSAATSRQAPADPRSAPTDDVAGVYAADLGRHLLQNEIDRSHRSGEPLTIALVHVDGLAEPADGEGRAVDDTPLRAVARALRSGLRSYDPVVRLDGDTLICGLTGTDRDAAEHGIEEIRSLIAPATTGTRASFGLALLGADDNLADLVARADQDLLLRAQT